ncbi:hypothetical protein J120_03450 [candidate division TM6 bacterium JCVI TM6SC1]|uniref:DUF5667 domain-containing protein n=1 Tax=candidate division TM6 bacterium JCVI TM6SC1 TaxID=1306947 RepID=A0A0D2K533_9BACT|nr:hypothetical protein J120_03450 [candidate division TM6 bacterium JCVI TM6SC1]
MRTVSVCLLIIGCISSIFICSQDTGIASSIGLTPDIISGTQTTEIFDEPTPEDLTDTVIPPLGPTSSTVLVPEFPVSNNTIVDNPPAVSEALPVIDDSNMPPAPIPTELPEVPVYGPMQESAEEFISPVNLQTGELIQPDAMQNQAPYPSPFITVPAPVAAPESSFNQISQAPAPSLENPSPSTSEPFDIDTLGLTEPRGNWLLKRFWWNKAEDLYQDIKDLSDEALQTRQIFFTKRYDTTREIIDPLWTQLGANQIQLTDALTTITTWLEKQKNVQSDNEQRNLFLTTISAEQTTLEQIRKDIQTVIELDRALDQALSKLMDQLDLVRTYERKAWDNFKQITRELSDKSARQLYNAMITDEQNIRNIVEYIKSSLARYVSDVISRIGQKSKGIASAINMLEGKNITLIDASTQIQEGFAQPEKLVEKTVVDTDTEAAKKIKKKAGIIGHINDFFNSVGTTITGFASSIWHSIQNIFGARISVKKKQILTETQAPSLQEPVSSVSEDTIERK